MNPIKAEYEELVMKIKPYLPIKAFPTKELVSKIKDHHPALTQQSIFLIEDVINTGDISGILCIIESDDVNGLLCSLTHIDIEPSEPLKSEIRRYQENRTRRVDIQYKQTGN